MKLHGLLMDEADLSLDGYQYIERWQGIKRF